MKFATVDPQFGYGWQKDGKTISVPPPFRIGVIRHKKDHKADIHRLIAGRVSEPGHALDGLWVTLYPRTTGPDPSYNVYFYEEEPSFIRRGDIDPFSVPRIITGFGALTLS
jgi:hypothetical protein